MNLSLLLWYLSMLTWIFLLSLQAAALEKDHFCQKKDQLIVAVIDTGADVNHPDLKKWIWENPGESGLDINGQDRSQNGIDDDDNGFVDDLHGWSFVQNRADVSDFHGHGTHVAGLITRSWSEFVPSDPCASVRLMVLKYYDQRFPENDTLSSSVKAFQYALANGARIINFSGGGSKKSKNEEIILRMANRKNVLLVAAAGNDGQNSDEKGFYPAGYNLPNILSVTALNKKGRLLTASNFGKKTVQIAAPGESLISSLPGGQQGSMTGTSQATAVTTGVISLLALRNPWIENPEELINRLVESSRLNPNLRLKVKSSSEIDPRKTLYSKENHISSSGHLVKDSSKSPEKIFLSSMIFDQ